MPEVKKQRAPLSQRKGEEWMRARHRKWGWDSPVCDPDFPIWIGIEYDNCKTTACVGFIEWKAENETPLSNSNKKVIQDIAQCPECGFERPAFITFYKPPFNYDPDIGGAFKIEPLNNAAIKLFKKYDFKNHWLADEEYCSLLYEIRNRLSIKTGPIPDFFKKGESN